MNETIYPDDYDLRRSTFQRYTGFQYAIPTGRIFDGLYYEAEIASIGEIFNNDGHRVTVKARPIMGFGSFSSPSESWIKSNLESIYFVIGYFDGSRESPVILGYIPHSNSPMAKSLKNGESNKAGGTSNNTIYDDDQGTVVSSADKISKISSGEENSIEAGKSTKIYAGDKEDENNPRIGFKTEDGKNYMGSENGEYVPSVLSDKLKDVISDLIGVVRGLQFIAPSGNPAPVLDSNATPIPGSPKLTSIENKLSEIESKLNFIE